MRRKWKEKLSLEPLVPESIRSYIAKEQLYEDSEWEHLYEILEFCKSELRKKKAFDIQSFDLRNHAAPFSLGLIASSSNPRHTKALAKHLTERLNKIFGLKALYEEGWEEARWMALDYGDLVIHIFYDYIRRFYRLEQLWEQSPKNILKKQL